MRAPRPWQAVQTTIADNLERVRARIARAAARAGRSADDVLLLGITKGRSAAAARALRDLGVTDLGENRAPELTSKARACAVPGRPVRWHFVGHLQRNKARAVVECADVIHSVDSRRLLAALERLAEETGRRPDVYLQVKLHPEEAKSGFEPNEVEAAFGEARASRSVRAVGLMTMAPWVSDPGVGQALARGVFRRLASLGRALEGAFGTNVALSMGMSADLEIAIEEGSTCVRVGGALFEGVVEAR